ncbi:hypothetical protein BN6_37950 [Saccharothrix espanaensis DSM 44229]|uniref:Uncharacterized protein n=2 Tax=Saccharothrix espanaensis TaxID=103731 RepID=K0JY99_SACES|nr:hypothetical protein BN6_37950 [Saccharothrix espanaensis DSM 44229]
MTVERLDPGPLRQHSRFRATIRLPSAPPAPPGTVVITSTVRRLQHGRCVRWGSPADGPGYPVGPQADENSDLGLETWLKDLKTTAEADPCDRER